MSVFALFSSAVVGCGSALDASIFNPDSGLGGGLDSSSGVDTGTTTDTNGGGTDTGTAIDGGADTTNADVVTLPDVVVADVAPDLGLTVDNLCDLYGQGICGGAQSDCCAKDGFSYSTSNCVAAMTGYCSQQLSNATSNGGGADLSKFGECMSAMHALQNACDVSVLTLLKKIPACELLFTGGQPPGSGCSVDTDCAAAPGAAAVCDKTSNTCAQISIVGKGSSCNYTGNQRAICDLGLTCVAKGSSGKQSCDTATPVGGDCSGGGGFDISCGYGFICDGSTNKCAAGAAGGAGCGNDFDCASWNCQSDGTCAPSSFSEAQPGVCGAKL
ncbi:MAG: hypothetical protein ACHREM_08255 [Polyangiales bacterium]